MTGSADLCGHVTVRENVGALLYAAASVVIEFAGYACNALYFVSKDDTYKHELYEHVHSGTQSDGGVIATAAADACSSIINLASIKGRENILVVYEGLYGPKENSEARAQRTADDQAAYESGAPKAPVTDCFLRETMRIFEHHGIPFKVAAGEGEAEVMYLVRCGRYEVAWMSSNDCDALYYPLKAGTLIVDDFLRVLFNGCTNPEGVDMKAPGYMPGAVGRDSNWNEVYVSGKKEHQRVKGYWRRLVSHVLCGCDYFRYKKSRIVETLEAMAQFPQTDPIELLTLCTTVLVGRRKSVVLQPDQLGRALEAVLAFALHVVDEPTHDGTQLLRVNFIRMDQDEIVDGISIKNLWARALAILPSGSIIKDLPIFSPQPRDVQTPAEVIATYHRINCQNCCDVLGAPARHLSVKVSTEASPLVKTFKTVTSTTPAPQLDVDIVFSFFERDAKQRGFERSVVLTEWRPRPILSWSHPADVSSGKCWLKAQIPSQTKSNSPHPALLECEFGLRPHDGREAFFVTKLLGTRCDCKVAACGECAHVVSSACV
jgi:hypothetical protein